MPTTSRRVRVLIIGAGFGGIAMALALEHAGLYDEDVTLVDAADEFGGTWRDNRYPGCACDVPSPLYSLRDQPWDWPAFYSDSQSIHDYMLAVVEEHGLRRRARLGTAVTRQVWDDEAAAWQVTFDDGTTETYEVVVSCLGLLRRPLIPELPGADTFAGPQMHSARWDPDLDVTGARVGIVGTGASAVQIVPAIAEQTGHLHVFQRTPAWVLPRLERTWSALERTLIDRVPGAHRALRWAVDTITEKVVYPTMAMDEGAQRRTRALGMANIRRGIKDPALREAVTPTITPGCKRLMFSNTYYPALARPDVSLHTDAVAEITPDGVVLRDGTSVDLDVLVYATGFDPHHFWHPIDIVGRDGVGVDEQWAKGTSAYLGITTRGLPNLFFLHGPNTGTGHTSVILFHEAAADYTVQAIQLLRAGGAASVEPSQQTMDQWQEEMIDRHADLVWASGCSAWYTNELGVNDTIFPGTAEEYRQRTARFDVERYDVGRRPAPVSA